MKKNLKKRKTSSLAKHKKRKQNTNVKQFLGLGPKIVNSVIIALNENDRVHAQKIVEGLSEYDLAKLLEVLVMTNAASWLNFWVTASIRMFFPN